jgi:hypothetical protein
MAPPLKLIAHDVTVHARVRIVGEIGKAFGINEGKNANTNKYTQRGRDRPQPAMRRTFGVRR